MVRVAMLTTCAMLAFAGNSVLCRLALGKASIDAAGFTGIRLLSGAVVLCLALKITSRKSKTGWCGNWLAASALFCYATAFSFAYLSLSAGTGALILFGAVQLTMILAARLSGEHLKRAEFTGTILAFVGLVYLVLPGVTAPSLTGTLLMAGAGIAWGIYCLCGRSTANPLVETAHNFALTVPMALALGICFINHSHISAKGALLSILSGGIASGAGYAVWYAALRGLSATRAAIVQLSVPLLATLGGTIFLAEEISLRQIIAAAGILGGIALAVVKRRCPESSV